jgi:hypothetical protein
MQKNSDGGQGFLLRWAFITAMLPLLAHGLACGLRSGWRAGGGESVGYVKGGR